VNSFIIDYWLHHFITDATIVVIRSSTDAAAVHFTSIQRDAAVNVTTIVIIIIKQRQQ
jgi:predicted P-loop ATPase/GTPase